MCVFFSFLSLGSGALALWDVVCLVRCALGGVVPERGSLADNTSQPAMKTPIDPLFPIHSMPDPFNPSPHHPLSIYGNSIDTAEFGNQAQERNGHQ